VHPGEQIDLAAALRGENGQEVIQKVPFQVPVGIAAGGLSVTFADGNWMNLLDLRLPSVRDASSGVQLVRAINQQRRNSNLYVRVWRADRGFQLQGEQLPAPPASLRQVLAGPSSASAITPSFSSVVAEMEISSLGTVVSGTETLRVMVKE